MPEGRLEGLDVLRGVAILLICIINVPEGMGSTLLTHLGNVRLSGWENADAMTWYVLHTFVEGTQRGLLQILLGASIILLTCKREASMQPSPTRWVIWRYSTLAVFGFVDIFLIGWYGDILLEYSVAALIAIPLRKLSARSLISIGTCYAVWVLALGLVPEHRAHQSNSASGSPATDTRPAADANLAGVSIPRVTSKSERTDPPIASFIASESAAHLSGPKHYVAWASRFWRSLVLPNMFLPGVTASFFTILIGMGLFKLGFTQGSTSRTVYIWTALLGYSIGLSIRLAGSDAVLANADAPRIVTAAAEISRLSLTLAYAASINLLLRGRFGGALRLLAPVGRTAFSLYLLQNFAFIFLVFNGGGLALFGSFSWFGLTMIALVSLPIQVACSILWMTRFEFGPMEWMWRSLVYRRFLPLRRRLVTR
jgi:uncharacterized protein